VQLLQLCEEQVRVSLGAVHMVRFAAGGGHMPPRRDSHHHSAKRRRLQCARWAGVAMSHAHRVVTRTRGLTASQEIGLGSG
jgi:hypothetical protein